jgi:hypothetical protein
MLKIYDLWYLAVGNQLPDDGIFLGTKMSREMINNLDIIPEVFRIISLLLKTYIVSYFSSDESVFAIALWTNFNK